MFDLTQREGIPTSQIGELTSTDLSNGVLQSGGYTVLMLGFDPWYRAWTNQEERLVLNAILFPTGTRSQPGRQAVS
jgi:hypothetical protein